MSKRKDRINIYFCGENAEEVTGSCIYIETPQRKILLECGLYQSNQIKRDFEINSRKFMFKPSEIDYVFINHSHADHSCLTPRLFKEGFNGKVIVVNDTGQILKLLMSDSAYIMKKDAETLTRKLGKTIEPIYTQEDVDKVFDNMYEYDMNTLYMLDEYISFEYIPAGHIIRSAQLKLYITDNGFTNKILYTSDLGNIQLEKPYVEAFEKETKANIVIAESTYGGNDRTIRKKDREKDLEKMKSVILNTCCEHKGKVLIPCFSLDRTQLIITQLYEMFKSDCSFDLPIIVDSPLSCRITDVYSRILQGEDKELFDNAMSWKNLRFIESPEASKLCVEDKEPKVILSASGMMTAGRSVHYVKSILPDSDSTILFCGFSTENSLAGKIKNGREQKTITIDGKPYRNKCMIVDLHSFTSHIQFEDMVNYYSQINCQAVYLVHGNMEGKLKLKKAIEEKLSQENKTTRIVVVNRSTIGHI
jgi:metallo-beta-lactamase family protein